MKKLRNKIITIRIEDELYDQLDEMARRRGVSISQIVREALRAYLDRLDREEEAYVAGG